MLVLALETSTSAAKALLFDSEKGIIGEESVPFSSRMAEDGRQNTEAVFNVMLEAGRKIASGKDVAAVAVSGVWHSIVICNDSMRPVAPTYTWAFTRTSDICRKVRKDKALTNTLYTQTGCMPNITYQPYSLRYAADNGLDLKDKFFFSQAGYNFFRLTGERLETANIISGMGFLNIHNRAYDQDALEFAGVKAQQFSPLATYVNTRPLNREHAEALGIAAGIPVVPPHSDGALNQVGNGATVPGVMTFSVGTSAAIRLSTDRPILSDPPGTWCYVGVEGWMSGAATAGACNCVNWFKESLLNNKWTFQELESTMSTGCDAPIFLPFLFGERCPGWNDERRGGFQDIDGYTDVPRMFQGICEGILFNIYHCYTILTQYSGKPDRIIMSGGIVNSPKWSQMAADIFGCDITLSNTAQASLMGGAALALHAAGGLTCLQDFTDTAGETIVPDNMAREYYLKKFQAYLSYYSN